MPDQVESTAGTDPPEGVLALAAEREERRRARDFAAADALRDRIAELGYRVADSAEGPQLMPIAAEHSTPAERLEPERVGSVLAEPPTFDASIHWIVEGWPSDVVRGIASFERHRAGRSLQQVVVDVAGDDPTTWPEEVEVVPLVDGVGWAKARNCGLRRSRGRVILLVDGSIEATGDVVGPLVAALEDPTIGIAGPFGIVTRDLHRFESSDGVGVDREVDAIEAYLMAFRRDVLDRAGFLDERFKFYRTCDIEYSFRVRDLGLRGMVVAAPVARHEHRMWANTPPEQRDKLSKRNFYRFLDRFRGRFDLTVAGEPAGKDHLDHDHDHGDG